MGRDSSPRSGGKVAVCLAYPVEATTDEVGLQVQVQEEKPNRQKHGALVYERSDLRLTPGSQVGGYVARAFVTRKKKLRFGRVEIYGYETDGDFKYKCRSNEKRRRKHRPPFR